MPKPFRDWVRNVIYWSISWIGPLHSSMDGKASKCMRETMMASIVADVLQTLLSWPFCMIMGRKYESVKQAKCKSLMELAW